MRLLISFSVGIVICQLLSCAAAGVKRLPAPPPKGIPMAVVVDRVLPTTMLDRDLSLPTGLACDEEGHVYFCDQGNNRVVRLSSDLLPELDCGGYGNDAGMLKQPRFLICSGDEILVSDAFNKRIETFDQHLNYVDQIKLEDSDDPLKYGTPSGLALTHDGSFRIADPDRNRLICMSNVGTFEQFLGDLGAEKGQLAEPSKVLTDDEDDVYVCDLGNSRVIMYDRLGLVVRIFAADELVSPVAAIFDLANNLWVLDQETARLFCFKPDGSELTATPLQILGADKPLSRPTDLVMLPDGRLIISDTDNNRLVVCRVVYNSPAGK